MRLIWALGCIIAALGNIEDATEPGRDALFVTLDWAAMVGWSLAAMTALVAKWWLAE